MFPCEPHKPAMGLTYAYKWAKIVALENRFGLAVSSVRTNPTSRLIVVYIGCDRGGPYRNRMKDPANPLRKNTSNKKCSCTFRNRIKEEFSGGFVAQPVNEKHNHRLVVYRDGHNSQATLDDEQKEYVLDQVRAQVRSGKIRLGLHIYNLTSKFRAEETGGRNRAQQVFYLAVRAKYFIYYEKNEETNQLTQIFMAHPEAVNLSQVYLFVVEIDFTYKTNLYGMPLVELIGVTPVGRNFTIVYVRLESETKESYVWVLEKMKSLLPDYVVSNAIVVDREMGLLLAIPIVFPDTYHLLCTFHIYNVVKARAREEVKDDTEVNAITYDRWKKLVEAGTKQQMLRAWDDLEGQYVEIKKALQDSISTRFYEHHRQLFSLLSSHVAKRALRLMNEEWTMGMTLGVGLANECGCVYRRTHGLLCVFKLHDLHNEGRRVHLDDIHIFWRTLIFDDSAPRQFTDDSRLEELISIAESIHSQLHLEVDDIEEPAHLEISRGRPRRFMTRNLSRVEHVRRTYTSKLQDSTFDYQSIDGEGKMDEVVSRINFLEQGGCGRAHSMENDDLSALVIIYNWTICVIGSRTSWGRRVWDDSSTYLPLQSTTGVTKSFGILTLLFLGNHCIRLRLESDFPMPPVQSLWGHVRRDSVKDWNTIHHGERLVA
ncbi:hypothetical protein RND81_02G152400 [Saponaria officinalis]|uniref:MULE transposase domain-containing protein n=1 Tax=Saponaria officinalis TaxID=3572 RepID=A0AAW1MXB7_SAPOF